MNRGRYLTPNLPTKEGTVCRSYRLPNDAAFLSLLSGAVASLAFASNWEKDGDLLPEQAAAFFKDALLNEVTVEGCMIGRIDAYITDELPSNVLICDGSTYQRSDYPILYERLPSSYRIDAFLFRVPNLVDRHLVGTVDVPLLARTDLGEFTGQDEVEISLNNMPAHDHNTLPHSHSDLGHSHLEPVFVDGLVLAPGEAPSVYKVPLIQFPGSIGFANISPSDVNVLPAGGSIPMDIRPSAVAVIFGVVAK